MRVVSWNVRSLRDDPEEVAAVLRRLRPDVVVVQEAPRLWRWRSSRRRLARSAGLVQVTWARAAGNLLLADPAVQVDAVTAELLPKRPGLHRRARVTAVLQVQGTAVCVTGTHLDLEPAARLDSARRVRAGLPAGVPLVLCADVNEQPGGPAWTVLAAGLQDPGTLPTFPAGRPTRRLDAVFVDPALPVLAYDVVASVASDHRPVVVDIA